MTTDILQTGFETRPITMQPMWLITYQAPAEDIDRIFDEIRKSEALVHGKTDNNGYRAPAGTEYYRPRAGTPTGAEQDVRQRPDVDEMRLFLPRDTDALTRVIEAIYAVHSYYEPVIIVQDVLRSNCNGLDDSDNPHRWWNTFRRLENRVRHSYGLGLVLITAATLAWSVAGLFTRWISVDTGTMLVWRGVFGAVGIFVVICALQGRNGIAAFARLGRVGWAYAVVSGLGMICFITALRLTTVAHVSIIYATVPLVAAGLGWVICANVRRAVQWWPACLPCWV